MKEESIKKEIKTDKIEEAYGIAKEAYAALGVSTDKAIRESLALPLSIHCWQGDDVTGFEGADALSGGGILATGNYPGRARNGDELRADAEFAFTLIPGKKRFNLHSFYAEPAAGKKVSRDKLEPEHFSKWMSWSKKKKIPLDFNPSYFSHPMADSGYTLASADPRVRKFWLDHSKACRRIASAFGENQGSPAMHDIWIPDGSKDYPADRMGPRERLKDALDEILSVSLPKGTITDAVESKLFGIGSESYVTGSYDFYMGYAAQRQIKLCLDMGHFHPTEFIADKISAVLLFVPGILFHFSRGLRWDSDHVTTFSDDLRDACREIKRAGAFDRIDLALDYFDASINRIAAWTIGARNLRKALLEALLEPTRLLVDAEKRGKNHERLALMEECKTLPFPAVWDKLCLTARVPVSIRWLPAVKEYEQKVLSRRK
ncbi:MAG: L-rhamnose isomerase [Spirochaetaceae bacterium]|jgi:L-rhamnose isomerase|nr:L-rhamnose isomerase [Spirochaetaceae bacterium]